MKATATNLLKFLQGTKQFIIPIYQRTYSWRISDCQQLWNDVLRVAQDEKISAHFLGSIVYVEKGIYHISSITQLLVIDGQQRLTTLSLLLIALSEALDESGNKGSVEITRKKICNYYLFNAEESGDAHYKLLLTQSDKETLTYLLEGGEEPSPVSARIKENYQFFRDQIRQSGIDPVTLYRGISKLIIVDIALEQQDNPQLIFESLNSTGMDLSQADLIRNYVLMGLDHEEQVKLYKTYWYPMEQSFGHAQSGQIQDVALFNRFMRDYLTIKSGSGEIPNMDKVYATFKVYHQGKSNIPIREIVADIYRYSRYFTRMAFLREKDAEIRQVLNDINTLEVYVAYPFLLEVYDDYENHRLSRTDFIAILKLIESYIFRRLVCGIPTHGLNKVFATLSKEIDKEHYLESVQATFLQKGAGARFPRDEEFRAAFVVKDMYNFRNRHYLLDKLENYKRKERVNVDEYTIEHVMPQNQRLSTQWQQELGSNWKEVHDKYLHTIGNLTLTGYNSELSDRSFQEKRTIDGGFARSPLQLNKSLALVDHWNAEEIEKRAQVLAGMAIIIWPMPKLSPEQISQYNMLMQQIPLEVTGPTQLPLAGFIPAGFKIIRRSEKRFYLYRLVKNEWIPYGDGKRAWYALSWHWAGEWAREKQRKDEMPSGVGSTADYPLPTATTIPGILIDFEKEDAGGSTSYSVESYLFLQGDMRDLFERLRKRILNLDPGVREEFRKLYIAYKINTNFVDIEPQKSQLRLFLNMKFSEISDPWGYCRDVTNIGHHGNGDVEVNISSAEQLDDVMDLVRQSFEKHWEAVYA
ncbi:MAG TPA: DUF262 and DUF1524 domain-containing protein [Ktedonobacteraceae bacterium]|nr:DUF262 and DUF1524 domain-containing protein [Ktedonobacteraceae bacterium]